MGLGMFAECIEAQVSLQQPLVVPEIPELGSRNSHDSHMPSTSAGSPCHLLAGPSRDLNSDTLFTSHAQSIFDLNLQQKAPMLLCARLFAQGRDRVADHSACP